MSQLLLGTVLVSTKASRGAGASTGDPSTGASAERRCSIGGDGLPPFLYLVSKRLFLPKLCHPASPRLDPVPIYITQPGARRLDPASTQAPSGWMRWVDRLDGWVAGCWIRLESSLQRQRAAPGWQERSALRGAGSSAPTQHPASRTQRSLRGGEMAGTPLLTR